MKTRYVPILYTLLLVTAVPLIHAQEQTEQSVAGQDETVVHIDLDQPDALAALPQDEDDELAGINFDQMPERPLLKEPVTMAQAFNMFKSYVVMECTIIKDAVTLHLKNNKTAYIITGAVTGTAAAGLLAYYLWYINTKGK